ncbi:MAG: hydrogenase formation protein HypD [Bacteroidales bacterium]|nr:hydrogenase formation protein HypD [Bacteroidales bacterium]
MNLINAFRDKKLVEQLVTRIHNITKQNIRIMEVCGGHTMAIRRYGIHTLLPTQIELLSGPGCPVCVTGQYYIDKAIAYARQPDVILTTYGDLLRVPGSYSSLDHEKAKGADVRLVYSTSEVLEIARKNPERKIIFAAIGFETTIPGTAIAVLNAQKEKINNFFIISAHKVMPPAMSALLEEGIPIDGYIGPGHVCTVAGSKLFKPLTEEFKVPVVISGFEPVDLLQSVLLLTEHIQKKDYGVFIQYKRLVTEEGNLKAQKIIEEVFEPCEQNWRGIGTIPDSGLKLRSKYAKFDADIVLPVEVETGTEPKGCICGQVLKGLKKPTNCALFGKTCTPVHPVGACMVSSEGSCNAYFQYQTELD